MASRASSSCCVTQMPAMSAATDRPAPASRGTIITVSFEVHACLAVVSRSAYPTAVRVRHPHLCAFVFNVLLCACGQSADGTTVTLPNAGPGIGFDDLRYSASLHRVLAPGGRSGELALVDPDTLAVTTIPGFSATGSYSGGHDDGPTSVDEGRSLLFVTDRTSQKLLVVDPSAGGIAGSSAVSASPDYVRYVAPTNEVWIAEP